MTLATIIDGHGQIGTRVYASLAAAPAPRAGGIIIVDNGTGGVLYVGLHDVGGVLAWLPISALYQAILTNPPPGHNVISDSNTGESGLAIDAADDGLGVVAPNFVAQFSQSDGGAGHPVVYVQRVTPNANEPLAQFNDGDGSNINVVNGYAEIAVRTYAALPAANTNHLGAIVRLLGGSGVEDTFWMCVLDATATPAWAQFIGPTGATGPAGPAGPAGPGFSFPALPTYGAAPVSFWVAVPATGIYMPWLLPTGYTIQVIDDWALWGGTQTSQPDFISDGLGNNDGASWAAAHDSRFAIGRAVANLFDSGGNLVTWDGTHPWNDAWVVLTMPFDGYIAVSENQSVGSPTSLLWLHVTVTAPAVVEGVHTFDFTVSDGGWTAFDDGGGQHRGVWASGVGWKNDATDTTAPSTLVLEKQFAHTGTIKRLKATYTVAPTFGGGDFAMGTHNVPRTVFYDSHDFGAPVVGTQVFDQAGLSWAADNTRVLEVFASGPDTPPTGSLVLSRLEVTWSGADPF